VSLSSDPFGWVGVTGRHHGKYFLLKSDRFDITLGPAANCARGATEANPRAGPMHPHPAISSWSSADERSSDPGTVEIDSDPSGADIYLDWKFAGQTPSKIQLASGPHHIELKSRGRQNRERELEVVKGSQITLRPALELSPLNPTDH
jgi:hypothetical protein